MRPEAAPPAVLRPKAAAPLCTSEQTCMACRRTASDSRVEKSGRGAGGAGAAGGRVVSGAAAEGHSTAASEQTRVMWSEQPKRIA